MRLLVLGAGQQGSACAYDLLTRTDHDVVLADIRPGTFASFLQPFAGRRLTPLQLDANDTEHVRSAMEGAAVVMSAFPYYHNLRLSRIALEAGVHYCDLGGNTEITLRQMEMHEQAAAAGVSIVPDCGLAPGMVNILARDCIDRLDSTSEVHMKVGGLPQHPEPPLRYQIVYSLEGVIDYYTTLSWVLRDGKLQQVEALSEVEEVFFNDIGVLEAFHTAGGLSLMAERYADRIDRMEYKTLRYPGHADAMRTVRDLGLLSDEPIEVKGVRLAPRDMFIAAAGPRLRKDPQRSPDLVALRVDARGERGGRRITLRRDLLDRFDPATGITAMMRTTGFSLAITALMQIDGRIPSGAWTPEEIVPPGEYVRELGLRGIHVRESAIEEG